MRLDGWKWWMRVMIEVPYWKDCSVRTWYCQEVLKLVKGKKIIRKKEDYHDFVTKLDNLSEDEMRMLLCCPREDLEKQDWIREYLYLADFIAYYSIFKENCKALQSQKDSRKVYIERYNGKYLTGIHCGNIDCYCKSWKKFDDLKKKAKKCLDELNGIIGQKINYDFLGKIKKDLFVRMDVKVCPYCNQQYVFYTANKKYLGDIDHVFPQGIYKLFSMSLWNLVPCCKPCNQLFKHNRVIDILNPNFQGFGNNAIFQLDFDSLASMRGDGDDFECGWKIQYTTDTNLSEKIKNNIELFGLNTIYSEHKDIAKNILKKKYSFDERFREDYRKRLKIDSNDELNYSIYGCSLNPNKFKDEILSKMIYDIVKSN